MVASRPSQMGNFSSAFRGGVTAIAAMALAACGGGSTPTPPPAPPSVSISAAVASQAEGATYTFNLTRSGSLANSSSVAYSVSGAANAADFSGGVLPTGTVTFAANSASASIAIATVNDTTVEPDEAFTVTLSNPSNATLGTATASATITNNDTAAAPTIALSIASPSKAEGSSFAFTATRSGDLSKASSASYAVSGAANAADFSGGVLPSGTVSFAVNAGSATIAITTVNDATVEPNEAFTVTLSNPTNATLGTKTASATIVNNDGTTTGPVKIVVLGASSAAGKNIWKLFPGTTVADEPAFAAQFGWVSTYGKALDAIDPANNVINLALSGYSTTRALADTPADASYPNSLAFTIANHSDADAVIISFPAIRGEEGETVAKVIANFTSMKNQLLTAGVRQVWIATSQPTVNATDCFVISASGTCHATLTIHQTRMDLTTQVIANFPGRNVDFYRPLSISNSFNTTADLALLNSVDLLHPNVQGHAALKDAMIAAKIYEGLQ